VQQDKFCINQTKGASLVGKLYMTFLL